MIENSYKKFSNKMHRKNWKLDIPSICKLELTFGCNFHCRHCYTDCYNNQMYVKKELSTDKIKLILDKLFDAGMLWVCFTGGDPIVRPDFLEIYAYAKNKGFLVTIYTNGYSLSNKVMNHFKENRPFSVEITLNSVNKKNYDFISGVNGSYDKVMNSINGLIKNKISLKLKTQVTKDNIKEVLDIKNFVTGLGLKSDFNYDLFPRLNGDLKPCSLRINPKQVMDLFYTIEPSKTNSLPHRVKYFSEEKFNKNMEEVSNMLSRNSIFSCAAGCADGICVDPYGKITFCNCIRHHSFDIFKVDIKYAVKKIFDLAEKRKYMTNSICKNCKIRLFCNNCPGNAFLETGDMESPIEYYCSLAQLEYLRIINN